MVACTWTSPRGSGSGIPRARRSSSTWRPRRTSTGAALIDMFAQRFGPHIPLVRRQDIRGRVQRRPHWQVRAQGVDAVRAEARRMEQESGHFYLQAAGRTTDASVRKLLGDLAEAERRHEQTAADIEAQTPAQRVRRTGRTMTPASDSCSRSSSQGSSASWTARSRRWRRSSPRPSRPTIPGTPSKSAWPLLWEPASRWGFAEALADDGKISGPGNTLHARVRLWSDDHCGRHRSYAPVSDPRPSIRRPPWRPWWW